MITALRHLFVDSWLGRLMALLTFFAFVVWGGNSIFNLSSDGAADAIISVGGKAVKASEFERLLDVRLNILSERLSGSKWVYSREGVTQIAQATLASMVGSLAAMQAAQDAGFIVDDEAIRKRVFSDPQFQGKDGKFDPVRMNMLLQSSGQTREDLIRQVRQGLYAEAVLEGLGSSIQSSASVAEYLSDYFSNSYLVDTVRLPVRNSLASAAQPTQAQLKRFYLNHAALFRLPEYRHFTVAVLTREKVASSIKVLDESLRRLYEERQHMYNVPQTRDVNILTFSDEKEAKTCQKLWHKGDRWETFAAQCPKAVPASLEKARKADIPSDRLGDAVFSARAGMLTGPVEIEGQWVLLLVGRVYPPVHRSFDSAKPDLLKEVQAAGISDAFHQQLGKFQEAVAGIGELKKLPPELGVEIFSATLDSSGKTPAGREAVLPGGEVLQKKILQEVFLHSSNDLPQVMRGDGQAFAVAVDETSPARLQDFQDVKDDVERRWREAESAHLTEIQATALFLEAHKQGLKQSLDRLGLKGAVYHEGYKLSRMKPVEDFPRNLANRIFSSSAEKIVMDQDGQSFWVAKISRIIPASAEEKSKMSSELQQRATESLKGDVSENLGRFYVGKYPTTNFNVKRFQDIIAHFVR